MKNKNFKENEILNPKYILGGADDDGPNDDAGSKKKKKKQTFWQWIKGLFVETEKK